MSNSSKASKRYADTNLPMPGPRNNQQQYAQADEETCSATLSDYFDHKENNENQKRQARAFVKEAFCEENLKLDVNQVQLMK